MKLWISDTGKQRDGFIFVSHKKLKQSDVLIGARPLLPFTNDSIDEIVCDTISNNRKQGFLSGLLGKFSPLSDQDYGVQFMHILLRECRRVLKQNHALKLSFKTDNVNSISNSEMMAIAQQAGLSPATPIKSTADDITLFFKKPNVMPLITPLVSILIPAYKAQFFEACLNSAIAQSYQNTELIIMDDSMDTKIGKITTKYSKKHSKINYIRNVQNIGDLANYLKCFRQSKGDLIKYLNDDDLLHPHCIETMVDILRQHPDVTLITSHRQCINEKGEEIRNIKACKSPVKVNSKINGDYFINLCLKKGNLIGEPSTVLFRKDTVTQMKPHMFSINGKFLGVGTPGDFLLWINVLCKGNAVYLTPTLAYFRLHKNQAQRQESYRTKSRKMWKTVVTEAKKIGFKPMRKHGYPPIEAL